LIGAKARTGIDDVQALSGFAVAGVEKVKRATLINSVSFLVDLRCIVNLALCAGKGANAGPNGRNRAIAADAAVRCANTNNQRIHQAYSQAKDLGRSITQLLCRARFSRAAMIHRPQLIS
jgi:hypothetical protein